MFAEVQEAIITKLGEIAGFKTRDVWQGDVEELLAQPQQFPSCHVILSKVEFAEPRTIGAVAAPSDTLWSIVIMSKNLRDRKTGAVEAYTLLEQATAKLTRLNTGYGYLWPVEGKLISVAKGVAAYGLHFQVVKET